MNSEIPIQEEIEDLKSHLIEQIKQSTAGFRDEGITFAEIYFTIFVTKGITFPVAYAIERLGKNMVMARRIVEKPKLLGGSCLCKNGEIDRIPYQYLDTGTLYHILRNL